MPPDATPRLTSIVCNYNHGIWLPQALTAMLEGRRPPDELIVVDDGSTDGSRKVIEEFARHGPHIRVIWHAENQGLHAGIAHALDVATGNWIYFGAADDYVLPGFFVRALELAQQWPQAGMICGAIRRIRPNGEFILRDELAGCAEPVFLSPTQYLQHLYRQASPWHSFSPAAVIRREAIDMAGGYRRELGFWADTFVCRVAGLRWGMAYFPEECMCFRTMPNSLATVENQSFARIQEIIALAQQLMRQPPFADLFPPRYVRWWGRKSRKAFRDAQVFARTADMEQGFAQIVNALRRPAARQFAHDASVGLAVPQGALGHLPTGSSARGSKPHGPGRAGQPSMMRRIRRAIRREGGIGPDETQAALPSAAADVTSQASKQLRVKAAGFPEDRQVMAESNLPPLTEPPSDEVVPDGLQDVFRELRMLQDPAAGGDFVQQKGTRSGHRSADRLAVRAMAVQRFANVREPRRQGDLHPADPITAQLAVDGSSAALIIDGSPEDHRTCIRNRIRSIQRFAKLLESVADEIRSPPNGPASRDYAFLLRGERNHTPCFVHFPGIAPRKPNSRVGLQTADESLQEPPIREVVGLCDPDVLPLSQIDPPIPLGKYTSRVAVVFEDSDPFAGEVVAKHILAVVGRSIVEIDDLKVLIGLQEDAVDPLPQKAGIVVVGNDDGDGGSGHREPE